MADVEFPLPKYARVVTELRRRIEEGVYRPGDMLPSEAQLVREFGIGRTTIVRALQMLQSDGWISREHGLGSYVKARPAGEKNSTRLGRAVLELSETAPGFALLHAGPAKVPAPVAALLGSDDETAVLRQWVSLYEGRPSELVSCWVPAAIAEGTDLGKADPLVSGIRQHLQTIKHARIDHIVERLSARLPDAREAELLQIATGVPVLEVTATVRDVSDVLLLVVAIALPGDLHELEDSYTVTH
jgi:DNA-binding GntR family transcriptional regulator